MTTIAQQIEILKQLIATLQALVAILTTQLPASQPIPMPSLQPTPTPIAISTPAPTPLITSTPIPIVSPKVLISPNINKIGLGYWNLTQGKHTFYIYGNPISKVELFSVKKEENNFIYIPITNEYAIVKYTEHQELNVYKFYDLPSDGNQKRLAIKFYSKDNISQDFIVTVFLDSDKIPYHLITKSTEIK